MAAPFTSPRLDQIRWTDVRQIATDHDGTMRVRVLSRSGTTIEAALRLCERWVGRGWQRQLECPRCRLPRGVLRVRGQGLLCNECGGRTSRERSLRGKLAWEQGGRLTEGILKTTGQERDAVAKLRRLAKLLAEEDVSRVEALVERVAMLRE